MVFDGFFPVYTSMCEWHFKINMKRSFYSFPVGGAESQVFLLALWNALGLHRVPLVPPPRDQSRVHPSLREKWDYFVVLVLRLTDNVLCNPITRAKGGMLWYSSNQLWLCFSICNANHWIIMAILPCTVCLCLGSQLSCSLYCSLLPTEWPPGWKECQPHWSPPNRALLWACLAHFSPSPFAFPFCSTCPHL